MAIHPIPVRVPRRTPSTPYPPIGALLHEESGYVWAPLRARWLVASPEELVRQERIRVYHQEHGFALDQMAQERRTVHGHGSPRADIVIARDPESLRSNRNWILAEECKAGAGPI